MRTAALLLACAGALGLGCGGGGGGGAASCTPGPTATLTITSAGLSPTNVCIVPSGTVTFTNNDSVSHHVEFETGGCPAGPDLQPGNSGAVTFATAQNCTFHADSNGANSAFRGTVAVTAETVTGGGY